MDMLLLLQALVMGIVEGITEFLPISSTGHLILTAELMNFWTKEKRDVFEVAIQLGAILSVCYEYRVRLIQCHAGHAEEGTTSRGCSPSMCWWPSCRPPSWGFFTIHYLKEHLFNGVTVACALIVGGFVILWAEKRRHTITVQEVDDMRIRDALKVGLAQCVALIPGTSRSGATIIGGLLFGLSRKAAAEFSFFLAIPTMFAATFYDVLKNRDAFVAADMPVFAVGFVVSFISALLVIRALMRFITNHDFTVFAWYRIVFGSFILVTWYFGLIPWSA
jgi:undecaprenyl-diphosphatase